MPPCRGGFHPWRWPARSHPARFRGFPPSFVASRRVTRGRSARRGSLLQGASTRIARGVHPQRARVLPALRWGRGFARVGPISPAPGAVPPCGWRESRHNPRDTRLLHASTPLRMGVLPSGRSRPSQGRAAWSSSREAVVPPCGRRGTPLRAAWYPLAGGVVPPCGRRGTRLPGALTRRRDRFHATVGRRDTRLPEAFTAPLDGVHAAARRRDSRLPAASTAPLHWAHAAAGRPAKLAAQYPPPAAFGSCERQRDSTGRRLEP
jgi:hypothetical protein